MNEFIIHLLSFPIQRHLSKCQRLLKKGVLALTSTLTCSEMLSLSLFLQSCYISPRTFPFEITGDLCRQGVFDRLLLLVINPFVTSSTTWSIACCSIHHPKSERPQLVLRLTQDG
ncbi:unnamed protein product [Albugo candida]|uniref:Uncharacterized protein n=1 Tax=Albugo candida TaxID=65357 RepID=A0A024GHW3_9STRA|nr:unnamed protein product [Albugo candida]|eukprot:CCI46311.1 unnamed protein product [Albugo candida]